MRIAVVLPFIAIALAGCAGTSVRVQPTPFPDTTPATAGTPARTAVVRRILDRALALVGTPYRLGGERPETGLDCSGLVRFVFLDAGLPLPRTVVEQFAAGAGISRGAIRPGDLVFFDTSDPGPSHVGIVVDRDSFVHAPGAGGVVRVDRLSAPYWETRLRGIRRVNLVF